MDIVNDIAANDANPVTLTMDMSPLLPSGTMEILGCTTSIGAYLYGKNPTADASGILQGVPQIQGNLILQQVANLPDVGVASFVLRFRSTNPLSEPMDLLLEGRLYVPSGTVS